jgi:hypothetical protein
MELLFGLIIASLIGAAIGQAKGRTGAGFLLGFLLGPIGWLLIILGPNPKKKEKEDSEAAERIIARRRQEEHMKKIEMLASRNAPVTDSTEKWRVSVSGTELGTFDLPGLKLLLKSKKASLDDLYFDEILSDWVPLSSHDKL